ncbi:MAG: hypothetical protein ACD_49C00029G0016 [uncultured bacterium (gcode 4)]|uniref:Uncharacterized protein n=1 Tax=uncultured bacterium (gcode 4) TaxID=1234023 RepID=K2BCU6_9BACT|nr:MAG: hypothetical protein ACD_49C00029G0016 [uncultured bacterium (gcode 4)]
MSKEKKLPFGFGHNEDFKGFDWMITATTADWLKKSNKTPDKIKKILDKEE